MRPRIVLIADQMARNVVMGLPPVAAWRARRGRTSGAPRAEAVPDLETYAYGPFELMRTALGDGGLRGATVVEIGPGDHVPVALLALAAGARRYVALDRFAGDVAGPVAAALYEALARDLRRREPALADALEARGIDPSRFPVSAGDAVQVLRRPIEDPPEPGMADVVLSNNVVEHVTDVPAFARHSFAMLRSGGAGVHRVDFSAHDVWASRPDPFEWLRVPDRLWRWMGSHRGSPNRLRYQEVREAFVQAGFQVQARPVDRFPMELVRRERSHLARRFRDMPEESLAVRTAHFVCRRP